MTAMLDAVSFFGARVADHLGYEYPRSKEQEVRRFAAEIGGTKLLR